MPASHCDHIVPKARGGTDEPSNLQSLCASHHSTKTNLEEGGWGRSKGTQVHFDLPNGGVSRAD